MKDVPDATRYAFVSPSAPPIKEDDYPGQLAPIDDLPPITVITHVRQLPGGKLSVRGTTSDNSEVKAVLVNGKLAKALRPQFAEWEIILADVRPGELKLSAYAEDSAGNIEKRPHEMVMQIAR
jgi:hypothetical protein